MSEKAAVTKVEGNCNRETLFFRNGSDIALLRRVGRNACIDCIKRNELIWIARLLPATASQRVDIGLLTEFARNCKRMRTGFAMACWTTIVAARPWLRLLG